MPPGDVIAGIHYVVLRSGTNVRLMSVRRRVREGAQWVRLEGKLAMYGPWEGVKTSVTLEIPADDQIEVATILEAA
jgi:hypothetical protein